MASRWLDGQAARDITWARKHDRARRQVWRIAYVVRGINLEAHIRADSHHNALRILAEREPAIYEARVKLADDQDREAENDLYEEAE